MDNLFSYKRNEARETIEATGTEHRFLPLYSSDLNPIELTFSKLKRVLRDAAERSTEKLWKTCGELVDRFEFGECRNYLKHCGYRTLGSVTVLRRWRAVWSSRRQVG